MADPFRLRVMKALTATLEGINPTRTFTDETGAQKPYDFDMRGKVFRGRLKYGAKDPIPMISILEAPIPQEPNVARGENTKSTGPWEILIQGFVDDDPVNPTDPAHLLMAAVKTVLVEEKRRDRGNNMFNLSNRVFEMHVGQGSVRPSDEVNDRAFFWLVLSLRVSEDLEKPYE